MRFANVDHRTVMQRYENARKSLSTGMGSVSSKDRERRQSLKTVLDEMEKATPSNGTSINGRVQVRAKTEDLAQRIGASRKTFLQDHLVSIKNLTGLTYEFQDHVMQY